MAHFFFSFLMYSTAIGYITDITRGPLLLLIRCQHRRMLSRIRAQVSMCHLALCHGFENGAFSFFLSFFLVFIILSWSILEYSGVLWSLLLANTPTRRFGRMVFRCRLSQHPRCSHGYPSATISTATSGTGTGIRTGNMEYGLRD